MTLRFPLAPAPTILLALVGLALPAPASAQADAATKSAETFAPKLAAFADWLAKVPSYSLSARQDWKAEGGPAPGAEESATRYALVVERPGKFALRVWPHDDPEPALQAVGDGTTVTTSVRQPEPLHALSRPLDPVEGLKRNPLVALGLAGSFLDVLVRPDLVDHVADSISGVVDLGTVDLPGHPPAKAQLFRGNWADGRQLELWFADAQPPLLLQARFTKVVPAAKEGAAEFRLAQTTRFDWTTDKPIPPATFQAALPPGSKEVDDLFATVTGAGATLKVGAKAPEIDLEILGGGRLRLADHLDRDVVVLNFWATWYPIGVESLPTLAEFAKRYAPRGVAFYQVNMAEAESDVEKYVKTLKFPMVVALDPEGRVMESYAVRALPFSVVIGRDGTIRAVNAGDLRGFRDRFTQQLDEVLKDVKPAP